MDFKSYLETNAQKVNDSLEEILSQVLNEAKKTHIKLLPLALGLVNACKGGKRVRGVLLKLGYEIVAGDTSVEIIKIAAAYEILHTALLIHDDVIDQSLLRRGQPSLHQLLGGGHYGQSQAIGMGDIGLYLPIKIIAGANFLGEYKIAALKYLSQVVINTVWGQILDVELPHLGLRVEEDVLVVESLKTAAYTISGPLILGATLAGAEEQLIRLLEKFGQELGIAFQIQDDILGVFSSEEELGKSVLSDIAEGKNTLLYTHALAKANSDQRRILDNYYGKGKIDTTKFNQIKTIFVETKALDYAQKQAEKHKNRALKVLPEIAKDLKMTKLLEQLAEYLVNRKK